MIFKKYSFTLLNKIRYGFDIIKLKNKRSKLLIYNRRNAFNLPFQNRIEHKRQVLVIRTCLKISGEGFEPTRAKLLPITNDWPLKPDLSILQNQNINYYRTHKAFCKEKVSFSLNLCKFHSHTPIKSNV